MLVEFSNKLETDSDQVLDVPDTYSTYVLPMNPVASAAPNVILDGYFVGSFPNTNDDICLVIFPFI